MEYVKLFTDETFKKEAFVDMLKFKMNVRACAVKGGIILDREAFNAVPMGLMPVWAYNNRLRINNPFCTRPAHDYETPKSYDGYKYILNAVSANGHMEEMLVNDTLAELIESADKLFNRVKSAITLVIVDLTTGEAVYTVQKEG